MTNGELVSTILGRLKEVQKDFTISRRTVISIAKEKSAFLIAQKLDEGRLINETTLYKTLECFPMKKIRSVECDIVAFRRCDNLMRSVEKLPELIESSSRNSIDMVTTIDDLKIYNPTTPRQYANSKKREFSTTTENTYYIKDGYLYLPDSTTERVNISLMPVDDYDMQQKSACSTDKCKSYWDYEFLCPDRLRDFVINATYEQLLPALQTPKDENPNMDSNSKSQVTP